MAEPVSLRLGAFRADQAIAVGRVLLAAVALADLWLGAAPLGQRGLAGAILGAYALYALAVHAIVWRRELPDDRLGLTTHAVDLATFAVLMCLTEGPTSPLFILLTFALLSAKLRWQWHGVLWTSVACLAILLGLQAQATLRLARPEAEIGVLVTRVTFLAVATLMLVSLGAQQARVRAELWRLAARPIGPQTQAGWPIRAALEYAADVFGLARVLLAWSEDEEPWVYLTLLEDGELREERVPPDRFEPWVAEPLEEVSFLCTEAAAGGAVTHRGSGRFGRWHGTAVHPGLVERYGIRTVLAVPVPNERLHARLFLLDGPGLSGDTLLVAEVVAGKIGAAFEQAGLVRELREATAVDERVRIARDLHDGVVQALAATALQLEALRPLLRRDPERAFSRLADLQDTLAGQQRELRAFIRALEPDALGTPPDAQAGLADRLGEFAARLEREWGVTVRWRLRPEDARAEAAVAYDLLRIVSEATANAVRHGGAKVVAVDVELDAGAVRVTVGDDGRGFAFTGRLDHAALAARNLGPRSLLWRVTGRGGSLAVESGAEGARLEIVLPRGKETPA